MAEKMAADSVEKFSSFLHYGPTGLAGLMLVLVIIALSIPNLTAARERLLRQFMNIGAGCFVAALAAQFFATSGAYKLYFKVLPIDMAKRTLPMPQITVNGAAVDEKLSYLIRSEGTAIIDVSEAIDYVQQVRAVQQRQKQTLESIANDAAKSVEMLRSIPSVIDANCPGGSHGISAGSNTRVMEITSGAASALSGISANAKSALQPN